MPNWVENDIHIKGNPRTIQRFVKALQSKDEKGRVNNFDFNNIIPCPEALKNDDWQRDKAVAEANIKKYGYAGWYDWNVANWGTKWNSVEARGHNGDTGSGTYVFTFSTAWSPVGEKVMYRLSRRFPSLTITHEFHEEAGMYPSEQQVWKDGTLVSQIEIANVHAPSEQDEDDLSA